MTRQERYDQELHDILERQYLQGRRKTRPPLKPTPFKMPAKPKEKK